MKAEKHFAVDKSPAVSRVKQEPVVEQRLTECNGWRRDSSHAHRDTLCTASSPINASPIGVPMRNSLRDTRFSAM
jgi:hypothetical protein